MSPPLPSESQDEPREAVRELTGYISKMARVHVSDGRSFEGQFLGVDGHRNLLLSEALELSQGEKRDPSSLTVFCQSSLPKPSLLLFHIPPSIRQ